MKHQATDSGNPEKLAYSYSKSLAEMDKRIVHTKTEHKLTVNILSCLIR